METNRDPLFEAVNPDYHNDWSSYTRCDGHVVYYQLLKNSYLMVCYSIIEKRHIKVNH